MRSRLTAPALAFALAFVSAQPCCAADAPATLATARHRIETADYRITGRLVRVDAGGKRTTLAVTIKAHWFPGVLRTLVEVTSPADARARILLETHADGESSIRIARPGDTAFAALPFERWSDGPAGAGFSYEDFLESHYFWPTQSLTEKVRYGARDCDMLKSGPGTAERTQYSEVRTWLDRAIGFPVHAEKTVKGSGKVKEFTYFGLRQEQGVWSASQVEVKLRGQPGSTLMILDRGSAHANLTAEDFSTARLAHF